MEKLLQDFRRDILDKKFRPGKKSRNAGFFILSEIDMPSLSIVGHIQ